MNHILAITGGSGFLGRHLIAECIKQNSFCLRLLTRDRGRFHDLSNNVTTICEGDLLQLASLRNFLKPDITIIHLAYINNNEAANIRATLNLVHVAKQLNVKRVVHCSTAVVIGFKAKGVVTESTVPQPRGDYQKTKYRIEEILREQLPPGIELAILRPAEIVGPGGMGLQSMIQRLRYDGSLKNFIYHFILKSRRFNYVSVYNVASALILLATTPIKQMGEIYNISDDDDADNNYESVEKIINSHLEYKHEHHVDIELPQSCLSLLFKLLPNHSPPNRVYSYSKISALGYRKVISLRAAISNLVLSEINNENP
jgi:nucleoside-diphosphate-sugar epimerase